MTTTREAVTSTRQSTAPLKVDAAVDELISDGAHFLGMTKKDLVAEAVQVYLEARREDVRASMQAKMRRLDGSLVSSVSLLTGLSPERTRRHGSG